MKLQVVGQMIAFTERETLVSGTINKYRAEFVFDDSWDGYTKTAVFRADSFGHITSREVLLAGDACQVPHECLIAGALLRVGVYGISGDITTPTIYTQEPIGVARGAEPAESTQDPTPGVYQQIINTIGDVDSLSTADKSSLVSAINEIYQSGGGGSVDASSEDAVELLAETGVAEPVTDGSAILTDANGIIYVL